MKKLLMVGAGLLVVCGAVAAVLLLRRGRPDGTDTPQQRARIRVAYNANIGNAPLYVAMERGYFAKEGMDVELLAMSSASTLMPAFLAGEADVAMVGSMDVMVAAVKFPGTFKIFRVAVATGDDSNDALVVKKSSPYKTIADLKGKKVGVLPGLMATTNVRMTAEKVFGDRLAVETVQMPPSAMLGSLSSGAVDAAFVLEPLGMIGEKSGVCQYLEKGFLVKRVMDPFVFNMAVISQKYLDEHPSEARAFVRAHSMGITDYRKDRASTAPFLAKYTKVPVEIADRVPGSRNLLPEEYPVEALEALATLLMKEKLLEAKPDFRKLAFKP